MTDTPAKSENGKGVTLPLWKRILFYSILLLIVFGTFEVVGQVYLRSFRGYAGGEFLQYQFDPYKNIVLTPDWVDTRGVTHNSQGFRRTENVEREKPAGTYRIFLMGASTAYGLGTMWPHIERDYAVLDNSETIDAYLEEILGDALPYDEVEVINAGIPSIWTHHNLIYLNQTILGFNPDLILFLDGFNDHFFFGRFHNQFASYAVGRPADVIMGPPTLRSLLQANLWWLFRKSAFMHMAGRAARAGWGMLRGGERADPLDVPQALEDVEWVFERNALKMIRRNALILEDEGIPAIFLLQPQLALERRHLDRMPEIEKELFEFNIASWAPNYEDFLIQATPKIASMIREAVEPTGATFLDLTDIYPESEGQIYTDYAHLTPEGNRILAEVVADEIIRVIEVRSRLPEGTPPSLPLSDALAGEVDSSALVAAVR